MADPSEQHPTRDQLTAFDLGRLPPMERTAVARHIAQCATCCEKLERVPDDDLRRLIRDNNSKASARETSYLTVAPAAPNTETPLALLDHPRYRILGYLGGGGMGAVFQAEHRLMDRRVALKVIKTTLVAHPAAVERFRLEIKAAARLNHPAIVAAYDAEQAGDLHFLVTEFVEGVDLERWVRELGRPSFAAACDWMVQTALGLQHAHERGMVHRDVKPSNLLRTPADRIKILDFGLARFASETPAERLTSSDVMVGTPDYMAPEQARDPRRADIRSDIYSLGCTLYFLLTGHPPFPGGTSVQKLMDHHEKTPAPPVGAPDALTAVMCRMMAKAPDDRYQTPREVAEALHRVGQALRAGPPRRRAPRALLAVGLLGVVLIGGGGGAIWWNRGSPAPPSTGAVPSSSFAAAPSNTGATSPVPIPPEAPLEFRTAQERSRKAALSWFEEQNGTRRDSQFMTLHRTFIEKLRDDTPANGFFFVIGGGLLKSGKTTLVVIRSGEVISEPLTAAQARRRDLLETTVTDATIREPLPLATPAVELFDLRVEFAAEIDPTQPIRGSVSYRLLRPVPRSLCLRFIPFPGSQEYGAVVDLEQAVNPAGGRWSFSAPPLGPTKERHRSVMLMLVDVCVKPEVGKPKVMLSNTAHILLEVAPQEPPPAKKVFPTF